MSQDKNIAEEVPKNIKEMLPILIMMIMTLNDNDPHIVYIKFNLFTNSWMYMHFAYPAGMNSF